jgi:2-amino-4-hydroxy-6-hydroxymethyldihydropteridine diphosphokinase
MRTTFLALGSNIGSRSNNLRAALKALSTQVHLTAVSPVYDATPMYVSDQPRFLNMAVRGDTDLPIPGLLAFIKDLERKLGRTPSRRFGPRMIDIDILFYGSETTQSPDIVIPHPGLHERIFVLRPLADIAPNWVHPRSGDTVVEMLAVIKDNQAELIKLAHVAWDQTSI